MLAIGCSGLCCFLFSNGGIHNRQQDIFQALCFAESGGGCKIPNKCEDDLAANMDKQQAGKGRVENENANRSNNKDSDEVPEEGTPGGGLPIHDLPIQVLLHFQNLLQRTGTNTVH